jgi:hypothetical protein
MINMLTISSNTKAKWNEITWLKYKVELMMDNLALIMRSIDSKLFPLGAYILYYSPREVKLSKTGIQRVI